jgi:hypothetical protein
VAAFDKENVMRTLIALLLWLMLAAWSLPLALFALVLWPIVWLVALPFRLLAAVLLLPVRLISGR